ncbi:Ribonucleoprotein PTB-binding 2 [Mactra antiquata]
MGFNGEFPVESVTMVKNLSQAIVTLKDPSLVNDAISKLDNTKLDTLTVSVSIYRSEKILCVAHLPLTLTEYQFRELVLQHGNVDTCFLMRSEDTGDSKGYGFVEYNEPIEQVGQIKCTLDWSVIEDQTIHCDAIVDSSHTGITFQDLHSKCLLIDNLPDDYCDSIALRELFSELIKPIYCQIVCKDGVSLGFGILEYDDADDAETVFNKFNGYNINGVNINIHYCIPGKSAVHMFNRIMYKYVDKVQGNKVSLLQDPVYPNPAFLKHIFFKTHVAKHPRLLVHFTDNLLHLQEGYVKRLENRTNAKPGLLGPPPTIPMTPLMDVNLQLGLLSVIVLDLREKGTYNGQVPEPLGKVKVPSGEEFQEKPQPVSLLGDPMTAQANIILKNILMPDDTQEFKSASSNENVPKLLGKPVQDFNLVFLCSFGRLMSMLTEKTQTMGILGNAPNVSSAGPAKPLMEGLMQAGKVAQKLLNSMNVGQQNLSNMVNQGQKGLLGNPNTMNNNNNTAKAASNFMNNIQQLAMQRLGGGQSSSNNKRDVNSLFGNNNQGGNNNNNNNNNMNNSGDGLLGNYQGPGFPQSSGSSTMNKPPQPLMSLNFNNKGDGLIPTPPVTDDDGVFHFHGNQGGGYDDSGYQGGYDDAAYDESYNNESQFNFNGKHTGYHGNKQMNNNNNKPGANRGIRSLVEPNFDIPPNSERYDGAYFSGINGRQKTGPSGPNMNKMNERGDNQYNNIAQQAAFYAAGAAAAYKQQYDDWMQSSAYSNSTTGGYNQSGNYGNQSTGNNPNVCNMQGQSSMKNTQNSNQFDFPQNTPKSSNYSGGYSRSSFGAVGQKPQSIMGPPPVNSWQGGGTSQSGLSTPQGKKRPFSHVIPSPEPSPEGNYVGQHSQGLGGHYADTYAKRQKQSRY